MRTGGLGAQSIDAPGRSQAQRKAAKPCGNVGVGRGAGGHLKGPTGWEAGLGRGEGPEGLSPGGLNLLSEIGVPAGGGGGSLRSRRQLRGGGGLAALRPLPAGPLPQSLAWTCSELVLTPKPPHPTPSAHVAKRVLLASM